MWSKTKLKQECYGVKAHRKYGICRTFMPNELALWFRIIDTNEFSMSHAIQVGFLRDEILSCCLEHMQGSKQNKGWYRHMFMQIFDNLQAVAVIDFYGLTDVNKG